MDMAKVSSLPLRKLVFRVQLVNDFRSEKLTAKFLFHKASWASLWSILSISSDVCFSRISFFRNLAFLFVKTARSNIFRLSLAVIAPRSPPQDEDPYICLIRHIVFNQRKKMKHCIQRDYRQRTEKRQRCESLQPRRKIHYIGISANRA